MPLQLYDKEQILEKCLEVFAHNGYKNTSIAMLAEAAGVSKALIFHHFKNKKELYLYILDQCIEKAKMEFSIDNLLEENRDFFKVIEELNLIKLTYIQKNPAIYTVMKEAFYETSNDLKADINEKYGLMIETQYDIWEKLFDKVPLKERIDRKQAFELIMITLEHFKDVFLSETMYKKSVNKQYFQSFHEKMVSFLSMIRYGISQ